MKQGDWQSAANWGDLAAATGCCACTISKAVDRNAQPEVAHSAPATCLVGLLDRRHQRAAAQVVHGACQAVSHGLGALAACGRMVAGGKEARKSACVSGAVSSTRQGVWPESTYPGRAGTWTQHSG